MTGLCFFAKTGEDNEAFSYELSGNGSYRWTICDMAQGTYKVTENGSSQMICASDEGGILSFIAPAGNIVIEKIDDIYTLPVDTPYKNEDTTYIKYGNSFINTVDIELQNSDIIVDLEVFAENLGYDVQKNITDEDTIYKILKDGQVFASLKMSDGVFLTKNGIGYTENSPYVNVDGKCKILLKDLYKIFYGSKMNMDYANMVLLNPIDYMNRTIYATSYLNGNELKVNVELINDLSVNMICGIFKDDVLIEAKAIEKISDGRYSVNFDILDSDNLEVKIFPWGDGLYPFNSLLINKNFTDDELLKSLWDSDGTLKISGTGTKVEKDGDVVTVTKTDTKSETRATASLGAVYQLGETGSGGYVHYSTIIRINSLSNFDDIIQFRVRGESDLSSTYKSYAFTASPGDGFKFDCIVDLRNACAYYYINGEKVGTADLIDWKYSDGSLGKLTSFQHYFITSPGVKDGTIELYDTYVAIYSAQTNLEKIVGNIGNILLKK